MARGSVARLFSFPNPVNEYSARLLAGGVVLMALATLLVQERWLLWPLAYGFVARVLTGPTLSPLGQLVTRVVTPALHLPPRPVPGPPKRFAQGIGAVLSVGALLLAYPLARPGAAYGAVAALIVAASLEAAFGLCLGCKAFALLMRAGIIPPSICEECNAIWKRGATGTGQ